MADEGKTEISDKEKETAVAEEKEKDTAGSPTPKSPAGSKPGSAKQSARSRTGSAKSAKGTTTPTGKGRVSPKGAGRSTSPTGKTKGKGKAASKGAKKAQEEKKPDTPAAGEDEEGLPEDVQPIFLASKTQELFECRCDEDVTADGPYKLIKKEDILADLFNRAAVCDFHPFKQIMQEYPGEEILLIYDADFKYGQNFCIALTEEAKEKLLRPPGSPGEDGADGEPEEEIIYKYIPPESKPWVSQGSEREIEEEALTETRKKIKISVRRVRREFGAPVEFSDRNVADAKDGLIECASYQDKTFDLKKRELDKSIQAIPEFVDTGSQTDWKYPRNASTQYFPREFSEQERTEKEKSKTLAEFVESVAPRFRLALQQNEIMDVFYDDWKNLAEEDGSFGSKADNHLKEYQSFTDLQFSKDKTVTGIDWHPTVKGVVAVACAERLSFDERVDQAARVIMTPSLILIWSFTDPIHPQLLLEAPDDILSFKFCPTNPNLIAGGCINGQLVLWDISQYADRLKTQRASNKKNNLNTLRGFEDENALDTPIVRYCGVSSIEHSHRAPITDILWVPDHFEVNRMGVPHENKALQCVQIMTCATDQPRDTWFVGPDEYIETATSLAEEAYEEEVIEEDTDDASQPNKKKKIKKKRKLTDDEILDRMSGVIYFWDTRPAKGAQQHDDKTKNPMGIPTTFKHLDLTWKPMLKVTLSKSEPGGDHSPTKFSIQERQGDRSILNQLPTKATTRQESSTGFSFGGAKPGSAKDKRTLQDVCTSFYVGTEDGELVYVDWMPQKDQDSGKIQTPKPEFYQSLHDGPVNTMQRSPFFKDVVLCIGGWTFSVWKEGINSGPILSSCASNKKLTSGHWSPTRPAVFYITKNDGSVDIWDLLDRTHEPSMNQNVSAAPITCIFPYQVTNKQQLLAVGDNAGTLHILEVPWSLRQPTNNELNGMTNYFDREVKRRAFVVARWDYREQEKRELEQEAKRKAGIAPNVVLTDDEVLYRMKQEYHAYLEEENTFLRELGLKEDTDEPLPSTD